jgi:phosphoglycerol transferase
MSAWFKEKRLDFVAYAAVALISIAIAAVVLDLRKADLAVPFAYSTGGDMWGVLEELKSIQENGSLDFNARIGAPLPSDFRGDVQYLSLSMSLVRVLSLFLHDTGALLNVYFLLSFPLIALAALYALRALGFSYFAAFVPALLYAFLPYHFFRGENHLQLALYWFVPLAIVVAFWIARDRRLGLLGALFCVLVGSWHAYYFVFAIFLFLLAAVYGCVANRSWRNAANGAAAIGITVLVFLANIARDLIKGRGTQLAELHRGQAEAEIYGLKLVQLLLPIPGHRIGLLAQFRHYYDTTATLANENGTASLGIVGSAGFLVLLVVLLLPFRTKAGDVLKESAVFAWGCFLFATIGGLSSLFNYLVTPDIRAYNRMSVYIAFFSLIAVAWLLEKARERWLRGRSARALGIAGLTVLLALGVADQSSSAWVPSYAVNAVEYHSDRALVQAIEGSLPAGAAVFQLPYAPFPGAEDLFPAGTSPYRLFKGYLHSRTLRWSYGASTGRDDDAWIRSMSALPVPKLLPRLVVAGFEGIYIERPLYADRGAERTLESDLSGALHETPLVSADGTDAFFSLDRLRRAEMSRRGFARDREFVPPLLIRVVSGCSHTQRSPGHAGRWCGKHAVLAVDNLTAVTKHGVLDGIVRGESGVSGTIAVRSRLGSGRLGISSKKQPMRIVLTVPPGDWLFDFDVTLLPGSGFNGSAYLFLDVKLSDEETGDVTDFYSHGT